MSEIKHNPELIAAVEHLYNQKVIKKDKDIVESTGYSKGTVSGYIKGTAKASEEFLNKFEDSFKIKLANFRNGETPEPRQVILTGAHVTLQDYIDLLKKNNERAEQEKEKILLALERVSAMYLTLNEVKSNSDATKEQLDAIVDQLRAEHAVMMDALDRLEKNKVGTNAMQAGNLEIERKKFRAGKGKQVGAGK